MTAYAKAQQLGLTGTDEEIVAILRTITARDVPSCDVAAWMRERGLWLVTPEGSAGSLYELYRATEDPAVRAGLAEWYASTLAGQAVTIRATRPDISVRIAGIAKLMAVAIHNGEQLREEFYQLCGGLPFAELTIEEYAAQRAEAEATIARDAAWSTVAARLNYTVSQTSLVRDAGATPDEILAAAENAWANWTPDTEPVEVV